MTPLALAFSTCLSQSVDAPTLEYYQEHFVVRQAREAWRVPIAPPPPAPVLAVAFRRNSSYAVWDERGLTIRRGDQVLSTFLPDVTTSPRIFDRAEVLKTIEGLRSGKRKRNAAGISGAVRIGANAFFLVRWEDQAGKPAAEVLVQVDLNGTSLKPIVLGRFDGLSVAYKPIDDRLFFSDAMPSVVTRRDTTWGLSQFDPATKTFSFRPYGSSLKSLMPLNRTHALFVESTESGTSVGGEIDLATGLRRERFEVRGSSRFIDTVQPWIGVTSRDSRTWLRNGETGSERLISAASGVVRAGPYVVVFSPYPRPTSATLYDPDRWRAVAAWRLPSALQP